MRACSALALGAVLLVGCGDPKAELEIDAWREGAPPPDGPDAVARAISMLGVVSAPSVHWYTGTGLDCPDGASWLVRTGTLGSAYDQCVRGAHNGNVIAIAAPAGSANHLATIAHELGHVLEWERGEDCHEACAVFSPGGEVDSVAAALAKGE